MVIGVTSMQFHFWFDDLYEDTANKEQVLLSKNRKYSADLQYGV